MLELHMPTRGTGGCIWTTHRTCLHYQENQVETDDGDEMSILFAELSKPEQDNILVEVFTKIMMLMVILYSYQRVA